MRVPSTAAHAAEHGAGSQVTNTAQRADWERRMGLHSGYPACCVEEFVVAWTNEYGKSRVFSTTLGHNNATVGDARYLDLVARGLLWSCDKLNDDYLKPSK